jgi:hypothetical protein
MAASLKVNILTSRVKDEFMIISRAIHLFCKTVNRSSFK